MFKEETNLQRSGQGACSLMICTLLLFPSQFTSCMVEVETLSKSSKNMALSTKLFWVVIVTMRKMELAPGLATSHQTLLKVDQKRFFASQNFSSLCRIDQPHSELVIFNSIRLSPLQVCPHILGWWFDPFELLDQRRNLILTQLHE